jgi:hypothetical protein
MGSRLFLWLLLLAVTLAVLPAVVAKSDCDYLYLEVCKKQKRVDAAQKILDEICDWCGEDIIRDTDLAEGSFAHTPCGNALQKADVRLSCSGSGVKCFLLALPLQLRLPVL